MVYLLWFENSESGILWVGILCVYCFAEEIVFTIKYFLCQLTSNIINFETYKIIIL